MSARARVVPLAAGALGAVVYAASMGVQTIDPRFYEWLLFGDWQFQFLGWHTYQHAPWRWPLGANPLFGHPVGTSVALTDSIPALAVPLKAFAAVLPPRVQAIGPWLFASFVLQGVFAALLMRVATSRPLLQLAGAALFVLAPVLIHRVGHPALAGHWLILAALWLHCRPPGGDAAAARTALAGWIAVVGITAATHPYLTAMVFAIAGAHHAGLALAARQRRWAPLVVLAGLAGVAAAIMWQAGYFLVGDAGDFEAGGFGLLSVNVLGILAPLKGHAALGPLWFPEVPQTDEGYVYLGAGLILLAAPAGWAWIVRRPAGPWRTTVRHWPLAIGLAILTALAIGPVVQVGELQLLSYDEGWWGPLAVFRANGRMLWPALYLLTFAIAAGICRLGPVTAAALLLAAVVVQAVDVRPAYAAAHGYRHRLWNDPITSEFWDSVPPHYQRLALAPTNVCSPPGQAIDYAPFALIAGDLGLAINAGDAARYDVGAVSRYCAEFAGQLQQGLLGDDTLLVFPSNAAHHFEPYVRGSFVCVDVDRYHACSSMASYVRWQGAFDATSHLLAPAEDLRRMHSGLSLEYERMGRPGVASAGTIDDRVEALRAYLISRVTGCDHDAATRKVAAVWKGSAEPRVCGNPVAPSAALPAASDTMAFRRSLEGLLSGLNRPPATTFVDLEGEAVWLHEYVALRASGVADAAARDRVLAAIRQITER